MVTDLCGTMTTGTGLRLIAKSLTQLLKNASQKGPAGWLYSFWPQQHHLSLFKYFLGNMLEVHFRNNDDLPV